MHHQYSKKEKNYVKNFKACSLDLNNFHHKQHLLITYVLLIDNNIEDTYKEIKNGVLTILNSVGVDLTKYHETMSYGWILIVQHFMHKTPPCSNFDEFITQNGQLLDVNILHQYYSKTLIQTEKARTNILNPDIKDVAY